MEEAKEVLKYIGKKIAKKAIYFLFPVILVVVIVIILLAASVYFITIDDGTYKEDDWSSTPYAAGQYTNSVTVNDDGSFSTGMSAQELWDKMLENGSRVDEYLDSPEELARLMRAEIVTQYPDTRSNPDEDINWEEIVKSDTLQGIIKFKRADSDNNISTMSYVDPATFQGYIDEYNSSGSETAKQNALTHFTLKRSSVSTSINYTGPELCWPVEPQFTTITSYFGYRGNIGVAGATADHGAIDIGDAGIDGTNTYACEAGTVTQATNNGDYNGGAGNWVLIDHGNGYVTKYMHMQTGSVTVQAGDTVTKGQVIGLVGTTGASSGPHCHFQIEYNGEKIDPLSFKYNNGMGEGTGGFGTSSTNNEADKNNKNDGKQSTTGTRQGGVTSVNGDGYSEEYTSSAGITYKHYKQYEGSYAENAYWSGTIHNSGCGPSSVAILASGLTNLDYTPANVASEMHSKYGYTGSGPLKGEMDSLGMTSEIIDSPSADDIKNNLLNGKVMLVSVDSRTIFTNESHIMAIVDINSDGQVYICNPGSPNLYGWYDVNEIIKGCNYIVVTNAGAAGIASTTNSSAYTAVVATWKQVDTTVTTNDPNVQAKSETQYTMSTTNINYEEMVAPYTMPFDYLWAFLVEGEDKDFIFELSDLVYGSDIQITVYDNLTVDTNVDDWNYTQRTKAVVNATITATCNGISKTGRIQNDEHDPHSETNYQTTKTVVTQTNTINAVLTRANVWYEDYQNDYTYVEPRETSIYSTVTKPDQNYPSSPNSTGNSYSCQHISDLENSLTSSVRSQAEQNDESIVDPDQPTTSKNYKVDVSRSINVKYYSKYVGITDNVTNTVKTQKYTKGTPTTKEKTDKDASEPNFVTIFNKNEYSKNRSNILNTTSWLFEILEINDSTKDMVDLTKYLLYKATGRDFGVTEFDFNEYDSRKFQSVNGVSGVSGTSLLSEFLKCWENGFVRDYLLGNADYNSTPYIYECITEDKKNYIMQDDLYTGNGNKNFGFGVCFWVNYAGCWNNVDYFREEGIDITDAKYQTYGVSTLSVEIVDRVKEKIIEDLRQSVRNTVNAKGITLTDYQIDALVALRYQGWYIDDFLNAYKTYGMDERIRNYSTGMGTSNARYEANWKLFSTGKYTDQHGNEIVLSSSIGEGGGSIIENAERIHSYMEQNNYFYCLDGRLRDTFEESKSSKGVCCATFVAWVLRDAGLINQTNHSALGLASLLENTYHWTRVSSSELQAGDAMVYNYGHIEIYAGNGKIYNAGSDNAILSAAPSNQWMTPDYGLRAP